MATNYDKYKKSTGTHYIANSGKDEHGGTKGGKAGDQSHHEAELRKWYSRPWSCVLRWPDQAVANVIADLSIDMCLNDNVGYDQSQRTSYWNQLKAHGYDPSKVGPSEQDCTAGVSSNVKAAGVLCGIPALADLPICSSRNMKSQFTKAGFKCLTASKYLTSGKYLLPGDILLYVNHHAACNITIGSAVRDDWHPGPAPVPGYALGERDLKDGDTGADVLELQKDLMALGWAFPKYGCDGDFGAETEANVKGFQRAASLPVTGVFDRASYDALMGALNRFVEVAGKSVNVRSGPGLNYAVLGIVHQGDLLPYGGERSADGWYLIDYKGMNAWISGKYGRLCNE